jgi:hypothetical protein
MTRTSGNVVLLHGRGLKPPKEQLQDLWFKALYLGLGTREPRMLPVLDKMTQQMLYYGDLSNGFLGQDCQDIEDRKAVLNSLKSANFSHYPGETVYGIDQPPEDIEAYWDKGSPFSRPLRQRIAQSVKSILESGKETILFAHSLGAVLIYDALGELGNSGSSLTLVTLGSPLTLPHFMERSQVGERPLKRWINVSARGDLICGPTPVGAQQIDLINPAMRDGSPDPHHALGYLCHPQVGGVLLDWLLAGE